MKILRFFFIGLMTMGHTQGVWAQSAPEVMVFEEGSAWRIAAEASMSAPPKQVWAALTDCNRAGDFIPHFESCRILEKDPAGRWDIRENVSNPPFLPRNRTIIRSDYRPTQGFAYKLVSGDMRRSEGQWELVAQGAGTRLRYKALIEPLVPVPAFLIAPAIKKDLGEMIRKLDAVSASNPRN